MTQFFPRPAARRALMALAALALLPQCTNMSPATLNGNTAAATPAETEPTGTLTPEKVAQFRTELLAGINRERADKGLAPLVADPRLQQAAQSLANDDAVKGIYSHTGLDGSTLAVRLERVGFPAAGARENTGMGGPVPSEITAFWMTSPFHRNNMLNGSVTHAGIGLAHGDNGNDFWVVDFGKE